MLYQCACDFHVIRNWRLHSIWLIVYCADVKSPDTLRDQLTLAIRQKDIKALDKAIAEAEAARYPELSAELRKARDVLENLGGGRGG